MKTIVVAINDSHMVSQFGLNDYSGAVSVEGELVRWTIHRHPLMKIHDGDKLQTNFDVIIDNTMSNERKSLLELLPEHRVFRNMREPKSITRYKINKAAEGKGGFIKIKAWATTDDILKGQSGEFGNYFEGQVVLKDEWGARGIGQALFDIALVSPGDVMNELANVNRKVILSDEAAGLNGGNLTDEQILEMIHQALPSVKFGYDTNKGIRESLRAITGNKLYLEQFVPNIKAEYRILFSPNREAVFPREIEMVDGFPQACGSTGGMKDQIDFALKSAIPFDAVGQALDALRAAGIQYGSADLFVTDKGWGLFEYSAQFAANGVRPLHSGLIQEDLIHYLVKRFIKAGGVADEMDKLLKEEDLNE